MDPNTGKPTDGSEVDEVSDKGTTGNQYTPAETFDLSPYRDDLPEALLANGNYQSANHAMNKDGSPIANTASGNQWQFQGGIRDVYIQVKKRDDNNPIIIGSDSTLSD